MRRLRSDCGMNIFELAFLVLLFAAGFVPGHLIAQKSGILAGVSSGFLIAYATGFLLSRLFDAIQGESDKDLLDRLEQGTAPEEDAQQEKNQSPSGQ
jgi:hypothetical protein